MPLALAFLLLLLEFAVPERASAARPQPAGQRPAAAVLPLLLLLLAVPQTFAATSESALRKGNRLYDQEQFEPALEQYAISGQKNPKDVRPVFNAGDALYRIQRFDEASEAFKAAASEKLPAETRAAAYYNLGNARFQNGDIAGAIEAFRKAVVLDPQDQAARNNLAVALKRQKNPPPKKNDKNDKNNKNDKKDDKSQNKNQNSGQDQKPPNDPKTRPQDQMSREDAERVMRAVAEKEKSNSRQLQLQKEKTKPPIVEEDW